MDNTDVLQSVLIIWGCITAALVVALIALIIICLFCCKHTRNSIDENGCIVCCKTACMSCFCPCLIKNESEE
jgi:hypothetical protein